MVRANTRETARRGLRAAMALAMAAALGACEGRPDPIPDDRSWIQLEHTRIRIETVAGANDRLERTVRVANAGDFELAVPTLETRYVGEQGWLTVELSAEGSEYTLHVYPTWPRTMWAGTHLATVSVDSPGAVNTPATLAVELIVQSPTMWMPWTYGPSWSGGYDRSSTTVLADGSVLVAGGPGDTLERWAVGDASWAPAGQVQTPRTFHSATLLADGRVLFAGGQTYSDTTTPDPASQTWELYDPVTRTSTIGLLREPRVNHEAVRLADGRVLLLGGQRYVDGPRPLAAEIFDPASMTTSDAGADAAGVGYNPEAAVALRDGRVLVIGKDDSEKTPCAVFDPARGTWAETGSLNLPRSLGAFALLPDGDVLAIGGMRWGGTMSTATERFDPSTGRWGMDAPLRMPRMGARAAVLPSGKVLVIGGCVGEQTACDPTSTIEVLDPAAEDRSWSLAGALGSTRMLPHVHVLEDGTVVVLDGSGWQDHWSTGLYGSSLSSVEYWREPEHVLEP